jgi:hypothetical protein
MRQLLHCQGQSLPQVNRRRSGQIRRRNPKRAWVEKCDHTPERIILASRHNNVTQPRQLDAGQKTGVGVDSTPVWEGLA